MPDLSDDQLQPILAELRAGRKISAIKLYREFTDTGLAEAKSAVEQLADTNEIPAAKSGCGAAAILLILIPILAILFALESRAATATPDQIDQAIKKAVDYLYYRQNNGTWETVEKRDPNATPASSTKGPQWGGQTAFITKALLAAGENPQEPRLAKAIEFLRKAELIGVYAIAFRAQVWEHLPKTPENVAAMKRDLALLLKLCKTDGDGKGFYDYVESHDKKWKYDHSVSQFGVLGCRSAADYLEDFPADYWSVVDQAWKRDQLENGDWSYYKAPRSNSPSTLSMTCAGVATLFLTQDYLNRGRPASAAGNLQDAAIAKGMNWMTSHYNEVFDEDKTDDPFYTLYGLERIGMASGYKYFDKINWYQSGADYLVGKQTKSGSFSGGKYTALDNTGFALLFLARGRAPLVMNKLQYDLNGKEARWNQRPRDLANLTRYIGKQSERDLNWQIVNLKAPVDELHDAPILYITGDQELVLSDPDKQKLRQFVEEGGMILAQADSASLKFAKSARTLGSQLFPQYEFRTLPQDHPIFTAEQFPLSKFKKKPVVLGMSNGARELMLLLPDDPAKFWQPMDVKRHEDDFQLGTDIFLYAVDKKNLRRRGETYLVTPDEKIQTTKSITVARLQYDGIWDPEPGGWKRLSAVMRNTHKIELKTEAVKLGAGKLKDQKIAHLTGATQFKLDESSRNEIKEFVAAGGTLIIDSAGGKGEFAQSVEAEMDAIFGADAKGIADPLPSDAPVYQSNGKAIEIAWRTFARAQIGSLKGGRLRGIKMEDRLAVIYSAEDLSVGLVGQPIDGINGYEPKTATALMANVLMCASASATKTK